MLDLLDEMAYTHKRAIRIIAKIFVSLAGRTCQAYEMAVSF